MEYDSTQVININITDRGTVSVVTSFPNKTSSQFEILVFNSGMRSVRFDESTRYKPQTYDIAMPSSDIVIWYLIGLLAVSVDTKLNDAANTAITTSCGESTQLADSIEAKVIDNNTH